MCSSSGGQNCITQQYKYNVCITIFSLTQLYLSYVADYNTTCFGPLCGPSSDVSYRLSYTMCMGRRDLICLAGVFLT